MLKRKNNVQDNKLMYESENTITERKFGELSEAIKRQSCLQNINFIL